MKINVRHMVALLTVCSLLAGCSGGGAGSAATTPSVPASSPATTPTLTIVVPDVPPTATTYPATSVAMTAASTGLTPAPAGEGVTSLTINTDPNVGFHQVYVSFAIVGGPQNGTVKTAAINVTSTAISQLSQVASFLKPEFGPFTDDVEGLVLNQSAWGQALSYSGFGLWASTWLNDSQGNGAGRLFTFGFGSPTSGAAMPVSGSATYNGSTAGAGGADDFKTPNSLTALQGNAQIVANFSTQSVNAKLTNLTTQNLYTNVTGALPDLTGTAAIAGNAYSGAIAGTGLSGSIKGTFYGPAAQETTGVWQASGGGINWVGSFGAK